MMNMETIVGGLNGLEEAPAGSPQGHVFVGRVSSNSSSWCPSDQAFPNQKWFVGLFDRVRLFSDYLGQRHQPYGPSIAVSAKVT